MLKKIASLFLVFVFIMGTFTAVQASRDSDGMLESRTHEECYLAPLREIVLSLDYQRNGRRQPCESEEVSLHEDDIAERLIELMDLFVEARTIQNNARGTVYEGFEAHVNTLVITGFGMPNYIGGTFDIGFAHDRYVEMIDFVIEFLGVPSEMVSYRVIGIISADPSVGQPTGININDLSDIEYRMAPTGGGLAIGTRIQFWHPQMGFVDMGVLGHPANASGRVAFGTNHRMVPNGAEVWTYHNPQRIGVVSNHGGWNPLEGLDVSSIRLDPQWHVINMALGGTITNHFGPLGLGTQVVVLGRGARPGDPVSLRWRGNIWIPSEGLVWFDNLIHVRNILTQNGDSGGAAVQMVGSRVVGTHVAGDASSRYAFISAAPRYRFLWPLN